ncbi:glutathione peroxidase [Sphingomonas immobilis]|uniref:Glutathione peroxidase n=1 Tax=Sphingomonas immobilis TaxID=3063997 RepID=A0ABT9A185_9SPHN|nr:glutathione peroxidase [Sphingomonas sp. CA1-15]MDO7842467.1 glutathione peroxidase [Sphingomonas sp. CA1-15]
MTAIQETPLKTIDGKPTTLGDYAGEVLLVVNVASKCGLTPQYEGLETLFKTYREQGFSVLGFPANDFGAQEPGTEEEIATFCSTTYDVDFPMFSKLVVTGPDKHPLYAQLIAEAPDTQGDTATMREKFKGYGMTPNDAPELLWNFEKFLIARDGTVAGRFAPATTPADLALTAAIEAELAK